MIFAARTLRAPAFARAMAPAVALGVMAYAGPAAAEARSAPVAVAPAPVTVAPPALHPSVPGDFPIDLFHDALEAAVRHHTVGRAAREPLTVASQVARLAGEWVMEIAVHATSDARVFTRLTSTVAGDAGVLVAKVWPIVSELFTPVEARTYRPSGTSLDEALAELGASSSSGESNIPLGLQTNLTGPRERSFLLPLAATGVAVAGVVVGAIFTSMAHSQIQLAGDPPGFEGMSDANRRASTLAMAANVAFGLAGLAALTGGMLLVVDYQDSSEDDVDPNSTRASATLVLPF